jgi:hypothetical protein
MVFLKHSRQCSRRLFALFYPPQSIGTVMSRLARNDGTMASTLSRNAVIALDPKSSSMRSSRSSSIPGRPLTGTGFEAVSRD